MKATKVFEQLYKATSPIVCLRGGARSSKSYSIAQRLLLKFISQKNVKILIARKTFPALRLTALKLMLDVLRENKFYEEENYKKSERVYIMGGSSIYFSSLDNPEKIKSSEFTDIWLEEANEFFYDDFVNLKLRMSGQTNGINQMYLSYNPTDERSWLKKLETKSDTKLIVSNYKDNPFLSKEYITEIEKLESEDKNYWQVFGLGEWGSFKSGLIYLNYSETDQIPFSYDSLFYGLDFGFNSPTALVEVKIKDEQYYITELIYETHLTNFDLIEKIKNLNLTGTIYCDSEDPQRIEELCRAGIDAVKSNKEVKAGIDFVKRKKLFIDKNSINLLKEIHGYRWKENKNGDKLDEPVKFNDHLLDAMRYAMYSNAQSFQNINFWVN